MRVRVVFLPNCLLVLSVLKHKDVEAFLNKKMWIPNRGKPWPLNNSINTFCNKIEKKKKEIKKKTFSLRNDTHKKSIIKMFCIMGLVNGYP